MDIKSHTQTYMDLYLYKDNWVIHTIHMVGVTALNACN